MSRSGGAPLPPLSGGLWIPGVLTAALSLYLLNMLGISPAWRLCCQGLALATGLLGDRFLGLACTAGDVVGQGGSVPCIPLCSSLAWELKLLCLAGDLLYFCAEADVGLQEVLERHKISLKRGCECVTEGSDETGSRTPFNRIYTDLYITEGQSEEVSTQHELMQLETVSKIQNLHDSPIRCHDIFKPLPDQHGAIRVVLTNGIAGVGKTFSVQKFTLDWAEGLENQDVSVVLLLSFRELNLIREEHSLLTLLHVFPPKNPRSSQQRTGFIINPFGLKKPIKGEPGPASWGNFQPEGIQPPRGRGNRSTGFTDPPKEDISGGGVSGVQFSFPVLPENTEVVENFLEKKNSKTSLEGFIKKVMEKSLRSKNGHLDLFVRFLHGLSVEPNQRFLGGLLGQTENSPETIQRIINNLKEMNTDDISPDRSINTFYCLMEMKDLLVF
ncbi:hypothetical protein CRENBAI_007545 [Crenichthys baileyi]|uniref:FISNA domain-containing protein n=1 Tax=Crenichthys baileyi TaxID=28760 RepID=A0AAV9R7A9_9TELE